MAAKETSPFLPIAIFAVALALMSCGGGGGDGGGLTGTSNGSTNGTSGDGPLGCPLDSYAPNYLEENDPSTGEPNEVHWWNHFPLNVYFSSAPTFQNQDVNSIVLAGMNAWSEVSGVTMASEVQTQSQADVVITYVHVNSAPTNTWLGQTSWSFSPSTAQTFDAETQLKIWDTMTVAEVTNGLRHTAQHEFGHVLFLGGHSPFPSDSMYPSGSTNEYKPLTQRDANSLLTAYCGSFSNRSASSKPTEPLKRRTISERVKG
jgi:hypothetical protein